MVSTIMVYKFPELKRAEIEAMFTVSDLKKTKVYQEALEEGIEQGVSQGELALVLRQLKRRLGSLSGELETQIGSLSLVQIEALGEALLDFEGIGDLEQWLQKES